ncbi:transposase [Streptomyces sp. BE133]|uniref:transposase n=1 Tax=Streptomyces sp. BE133 TaxID=3002523 RepID=UPI003FA77735
MTPGSSRRSGPPAHTWTLRPDTSATSPLCLPALHSLVIGLRRDQDAVVAGLSSSWSSGQVEGHVTRIKLIKRKGYGRAELDLLRKRILLAT